MLLRDGEINEEMKNEITRMLNRRLQLINNANNM